MKSNEVPLRRRRILSQMCRLVEFPLAQSAAL